MSPVPPARSSTRSPLRTCAVATKKRFHSRWMPRLMASFIRSYLPATEVNTSPTSFCFSATGTSRKPKWVVPGSVLGCIHGGDYRTMD